MAQNDHVVMHKFVPSILLLFVCLCINHDLNARESDYQIEISKSAQELRLKKGNQIVMTYRIALGSGGKGAKRQLGDKKTPVGKAKNMITWYEIHPYENRYQLHQKNKAISPQREFNIIKICTSILAQLFLVKRTTINNSKQASISFFNDIPWDKIFGIYNYDDISLDNVNLQYEITLPKIFP